MTAIIPVILSGGVGSRLWPLSRESHPKQFIRLSDNISLIQKSYIRSISINSVKEIITVTNKDLFFYTKNEFQKINTNNNIKSTYILEPFGKNTAPAIAYSSLYVNNKYGKDAIMVVFPADHIILKEKEFLKSVSESIDMAKNNKIVTFGITPDEPKTCYGYIESKGTKVLRFIEKPDFKKAEYYLKNGNFFWNSGIFCFSAQSIIDEFKLYCPSILKNAKSCIKNSIFEHEKSFSKIEIGHKHFKKMNNISIDYAVLEKSKKINIITRNIGWTDIGSWLEFGKLYNSDKLGNRVSGNAVLEKSKDCIIFSENKLVACLGVKDLIVVNTEDVLLISHKNKSQDIKDIFFKIKKNEEKLCKYGSVIYKPWGNYKVLSEGKCFKVKRIEVNPKSSLSLQMHFHRSEHWVVVQGAATVVNGQKTINLRVNESTYIPCKQKHRLINKKTYPLVLIETQCGNYLEEDDIIRFEDIYRKNLKK